MQLIKLATKALVHACGGVERSALIAGVSKSTVSKWQNQSDPSTITAYAMMMLESDFGYPLVSSMIAGREPLGEATDMDHIQLVSMVHKETTEANQAIIDGEAAQMWKEIPEAITALAMAHAVGTKQ